MNDYALTIYGLRRINHDVDKSTETINQWVGVITYETTATITDESNVARDLESLLTTGKLPIIGYMPSLRGIRFHWDTRPIADNEVQEYCIVALKYISQLQTLRQDEIENRLKVLGYEESK